MNDVMIIANPSSGKKRAEEYGERVKRTFLKHHRKSEIRLTENKEDIFTLAKEARDKECETVVVIGGDGTVSELANALSELEYKPAIGIIPSGTVNNIARGLTMPNDPDEIADNIADYKEKKADAGKVNNRIFLSSVSAGPVPETVWEVTDEQKKKYGQVAYFMEGLKTLKDEDTYKMNLELDGNNMDAELNLIIIGLSSSIAGIPEFFEDAESDDGKLYLFGLKPSSIGQKITVMQALLFSKETFNEAQEKAFTVSFERAVLTLNDKEAFTAVDGEQGPSFPVEIEVLPQYFTFLVPEIK